MGSDVHRTVLVALFFLPVVTSGHLGKHPNLGALLNHLLETRRTCLKTS